MEMKYEKLGSSAMEILKKMKETPLTKRIKHEQMVMGSEGIMLACQLFEEAKESYENGDMEWKEAVYDLHQNLLEIPKDLFSKKPAEQED